MSMKYSIEGRIFKKSSFSPVLPRVKCVDVSIGENDVLVTNLSDKDSSILRFKHDEWVAFIKGVKNEEFDL